MANNTKKIVNEVLIVLLKVEFNAELITRFLSSPTKTTLLFKFKYFILLSGLLQIEDLILFATSKPPLGPKYIHIYT